MNKISLLVAYLLCFTSIVMAKTTTTEADARFDNYKESFVQEVWKIYPLWAASVGYHKYDSQLPIPDEQNRREQITFCTATLNSLRDFDLKILSDANKTDYYLIENQVKYTLWGLQEEKAYEWDPSQYNIAETFATILNENYDTLDNRLYSFYLKMAYVPAYYEAAEKNIKNPTLEHTQLAIDQNL